MENLILLMISSKIVNDSVWVELEVERCIQSSGDWRLRFNSNEWIGLNFLAFSPNFVKHEKDVKQVNEGIFAGKFQIGKKLCSK